MLRRDFVVSGVMAGVGAGVLAKAQEEQAKPEGSASFKLKYAPHFGMFRHHAPDLLDQLRFARDQGFSAWEDNGMMGRPTDFQEKFAQLMRELGMTMGVFVSYSGFGKTDMLVKTDKDYQDSLRAAMRKALETAARVGAKWSTVVPGNIALGLDPDYQTANLVENLKVMAEVCEQQEHVMVLEPLNWWANHPGLFLTRIPQAYQICQAVGSPSCKILDDLYHQQISEGNLIPNMDKAWSEIAYIQVGDNPGRNEPTTGEINYRNVFRHLADKGYAGVVGMEHGNSRGGKEGEQAVIEAYRYCDNF
jgi:hydroxypyruvate isomerase